ncbi:PucR family transcriptional regulator [Lentzea aerocolonigenes]|uniref:PucR family transcriptional regulator n=1 Tax=Lentzea aerocolonigenes TaxID=68170 RepID=UPI0004C4339E|nr:PucR family transcriptional regulator ligand-binding domain-containing protein [Lentzea aerocolonigenes]MCP2246001.1 transcriptional regulator, CdaR family [Lentzea aerocolonigenes]
MPENQGSAPLTVAGVLALPVLAAGLPEVVVGGAGLDRLVRWVHITELTDPASFLKGGELVLTTGVPLPGDTSQVRRYVDELADVGAAALVLELVRRFHRPPDDLIRACQARRLPLITLARDVNFLEVTQVVHTLILGNQTEVLRRTQKIHDTFTALTLRGAGPEEVVRTAVEMTHRTVVLENLAHQAVICEPADVDAEVALERWEQRSRATVVKDRTEVLGPEGWLATPVEFQGERWGRVVMLPGKSFGADDVTVLERAAMTLTIARLIHSTSWERNAHRSVLQEIAEQRYRSPTEARARAAALGLPAADASFLAVLVDTPRSATEVETLLSQTLERTALVGTFTDQRVGVLLFLRRGQPWQSAVELLSRAARAQDAGVVVSVGCEVTDLAHVARSFREAGRVAEAVLPGSTDRLFYQLSDIGLRHLLHTLRDDIRVQDYVERQIGRLVEHDARHGTELLPTLRHYLDAAGNKTIAARRGGISRQTLYERLRLLERLLERDLEAGEHRTELHVALLLLDVLRG